MYMYSQTSSSWFHIFCLSSSMESTEEGFDIGVGFVVNSSWSALQQTYHVRHIHSKLIPNLQKHRFQITKHLQYTTTILRPFFRDHPGAVPEANFYTLWCKGRLTEVDTLSIRLCATPSGLTSAHLHHLPHIFYRPDALPAAQPTASNKDVVIYIAYLFIVLWHQSTEGNTQNCKHW